MKNFRSVFVILFLFALCVGIHAQQRLLGGDISLLPSYEKAGTIYRNEKGKVIKRGSRNLVGIIVSYSHPKFRPLPHGNKSIGGVGSHRASL